MPGNIPPWQIVAAILAVFSAAAHFTKVLSALGIVFAVMVGIIAFASGGFPAFFTLIIFYCVAEAATRLGRKKNEGHEQRSAGNIIGNSIPAIACLLLGYPIGFFGAVSAAFADTISSEIGMLSRKKPVLITTFKEVKKGTDGGITALGMLSSAIAAAIIGAAYYFMVANSPKIFAIIVVSGIGGSVVDSLLGAVFEKKGRLDNTQVNFIASLFGGIIALALAWAI